MLVHSLLPWREIHDFRKYRPEVLAFLEKEASIELHVSREQSPYAWHLQGAVSQLALTPGEAGLRLFFGQPRHSRDEVQHPGHGSSVPVKSHWTEFNFHEFRAEQNRFDSAVSLAAALSADAPAQVPQQPDPTSLPEFVQACLRTICLESPLLVTADLEAAARELLTKGYATLDFTGQLRARAVWELEPAQRKLERVRQTFAG